MHEDNDGDQDKYILHEQIIFKQNISQYISEERDKAIRHILWTVENHLEKGSKEEGKIRKSVLDAINDLYRKVCIALDRVV